MTAKLARAVMTVAEACIGEQRGDWALAMRVELDSAVADGEPLRFAIGCLIGALREMPVRSEGRFTLTSHLVALGLLPIAALLVLSTLPAMPFPPSGQAVVPGWNAGGGGELPMLSPWTCGVAPALALLVWTLAAGHLVMSWYVVDRNWQRVAMLARFNGAATITLFLFIGTLFLDVSFVMLPIIGLAIEYLAIWSLFRWQTRLFGGAPPEFAGT